MPSYFKKIHGKTKEVTDFVSISFMKLRSKGVLDSRIMSGL